MLSCTHTCYVAHTHTHSSTHSIEPERRTARRIDGEKARMPSSFIEKNQFYETGMYALTQQVSFLTMVSRK